MFTQHVGSTDHMTVTYKFAMVYKHQLSLSKSFVSHTLPCNILDTLSNVYTQTYIQELYIFKKKKEHLNCYAKH